MFGLFGVWTLFTVLPVFRHDHEWSCFRLDLSWPQRGLSDTDVMFNGRTQGLQAGSQLSAALSSSLSVTTSAFRQNSARSPEDRHLF